MSILQAIWPFAFKVKKKELGSFLLWLIIGIVVAILFGVLMGVLGHIAVVGVIFRILGSLVEIYTIAHVVFCILKFVGVF